MKALIVAGGSIPKYDIFLFYSRKSDLIIGVDGGCKYLIKNNIFPDYIVGDFDSSKEEDIEFLEGKGAIKCKYSSEKDFTDSEIALNLAIENGASEIILLGGAGSRFDHTFANVGLMYKALKRGIGLIIVNSNNKICMVSKDTEFKRDENYKYISFLAYKDDVIALQIEGAKYNLDNFNLEVGEGRTVSNEFLHDKIRIHFKSGILLAVYSKD